MQGTADGKSSSTNKCSGDQSYTTPCSVVTTSSTKSNNVGSSATFTGSIIFGGTTYDVAGSPSQYSNGYISENDYSYRTVTNLV